MRTLLRAMKVLKQPHTLSTFQAMACGLSGEVEKHFLKDLQLRTRGLKGYAKCLVSAREDL